MQGSNENIWGPSTWSKTLSFHIAISFYITQKVELGCLIKKDAIKDEINSDVELDKMDNNSGDEKPYR